MKKRKLPHFKTEKEAAEFWSTHRATEYLHELEPVDNLFMLSPHLAHKIRERAKRRMISIRLAEWQIETSKQIAKRRKMPYQALLREWIDAGLRSAFAKDRGARQAPVPPRFYNFPPKFLGE